MTSFEVENEICERKKSVVGRRRVGGGGGGVGGVGLGVWMGVKNAV